VLARIWLLRRRWLLGRGRLLGACGCEADIVESEVIEISGAGVADFMEARAADEAGAAEVEVVKPAVEIEISQAAEVEVAQAVVEDGLIQAADAVFIARPHVKQTEGAGGIFAAREIDELVEVDLSVAGEEVRIRLKVRHLE
jgi:hypothetical protein